MNVDSPAGERAASKPVRGVYVAGVTAAISESRSSSTATA